MIILPAIDIKDGNCVRLFKGDYATVQKVAESPYIAAQGFADAGAGGYIVCLPNRIVIQGEGDSDSQDSESGFDAVV